MLLYLATARHQHEVMLTKEQLLEKEQLLQQFRGKEEDTIATISSKTSQLLAIKTLLEETQAALEQEREKSKLAMVERERWVWLVLLGVAVTHNAQASERL